MKRKTYEQLAEAIANALFDKWMLDRTIYRDPDECIEKAKAVILKTLLEN